MGRLDGKVALVGGSMGKLKGEKFIENLGTQIARELKEEGATVVIVDNDFAVAQKAAEVVGVKAMECDLLKDRTYDGFTESKLVNWTDNPALDLVKAIVAEYGKLDILVPAFNSFPKMKKLNKLTPEDFDIQMKDNIWPAFHLLAAVREQFKKQNAENGARARVVMVSSVAGKAGMSMGVIYSGLMAGLVGLNKGLCRELGRFADINNVCPGPFKNRNSYGPGDRIKSQYMVTKSDSANLNLEFKHVSPVVAFLASDDAAAISGQSISVDGGLWLKLEI